MLKKLLFILIPFFCLILGQDLFAQQTHAYRETREINNIKYEIRIYSNSAIVVDFLSNADTQTIPSTIRVPYNSKIYNLPVTDIKLDNDSKNVHNIKRLFLPSSLIQFSSCHRFDKLEYIFVDEDNSVFSSVDGVLFSKSKKTLIKMPCHKTGNYEIPQITDSISERAFSGSNLKMLDIHENVCSIGKGAFSFAEFRKGINVSVNNKKFKIINDVLCDCENNRLLFCNKLIKEELIIPHFIIEIDGGSITNCTGITSIIFPYGISKMGFNAVAGCTNCKRLFFLGSIKGWHGDFVNCFDDIDDSYIYLRRTEFDDASGIAWRRLGDINEALGITIVPYVYGFNITTSKSYEFDNLTLNEVQISENDTRHITGDSGNYNFLNLEEKTDYQPLVKFNIGNSAIIAELKLTTLQRKADINAICTQTSAEIRINATEDITCKPTKCGLTYDGKEYFANKDNIVNLNGLSLNQTYSVYPFAYYGEELISESRKDFTTKDVSYTLLTKNIGPTHCELDVDVDAGDAQIISSGFSNGRDRIIATGLAPDKDYTFTLNVNTKAGQSSNNYKITTSKLEIETLQPKVVSSGCAIVGATTNISDYENSAGFQWKKYDAPESLKPNEANAIIYDGSMEGYIKNLQPTSFYNVRVFYKDADGKYYFGDWVTFDPADFSYFEPTVHTYATTECSHNTAFVKGYAMQGSEPITEQGFQYWEEGNRYINVKANESPQIHTITATGQIMTATIENLKSETAYKFRAYARTVSGIITGEEQEFTTKSAPSGVEDVAVSPEGPKIEAYYNIGGCRSDKPFEGLNIVIYSNGTTRKIIYRQQ